MGAVLGTLAFFAVSKDARHRLHAAAQAFRDPSLLEAQAAQALPAAATLPLVADVSELKLAGDFANLPDESDDPDTSFLRTLVLPDLRVPVTRRTMRYVRLFTKTESGRQSFLARYRRAGAYREIVERALRDAGLPEDLEWVAAIESGFDPRAMSPKGAAGLWQFMPETGQSYGLYQSQFIDERMNLVSSTRAAVSHLRDLYERFGRWDLALASYNYGYDGVIKAMERYLASPAAQSRRPGAAIELSELSEAKVIPEETSNYVPQIFAFAIVAANRSRFGLDVASLAPAEPLELGEITVPAGTRLRTLARAAGMSTSSLHDYNPQLLRDRVPPSGGDVIVYVPADRVQRVMLSFPVFQDHEILVDDEGAEPTDEPPDPLAGPAAARPHNHLPAFVVPGQVRGELEGPSPMFAALNVKLPRPTGGSPFGEIGWRRPGGEDSLALLNGGASPRKSREVVLDVAAEVLGPKALSPLAPADSFVLPSGVTVEIVQQPSAAVVAITTRIAGDSDVKTAGLIDLKGLAASEERHTITVPARSLEAGIDVAVRRLRLALAENDGAALRRAASAPYRHDLTTMPAGAAWLALGDALFPKGHPLEGAVISGRSDAALYCDLFLADQMRKERAPRRATVTIAGDVSRSRVEKAFESAVLAMQAADQEIPQHPKEERVSLESPTQRLLYGWIGPAEGQPGHAAMRVAIEILAGSKNGRLRKALLEENKLATEIAGLVEPNPRSAVAAIDIVPLGDTAAAGIEERLDGEIASLAEVGPTANELALARALIGARIEKAKKAAQPASGPNGKPGTTPLGAAAIPSASRALLDPAAYDRLLSQLGEVAPTSVKLAAKKLLAKDHRVVVIAAPAKKSTPPSP
ncbi:MAG: transglycosylase SLT domain-containing protein [Polyangiaceae bacterium]